VGAGDELIRAAPYAVAFLDVINRIQPLRYPGPMEIRDLQQVWEEWAQADPMWAILSDPTKTQRRWGREEFFATGKAEIRDVMADLSERGIDPRRGRCLDFGCGIGRLTQALAEYFDRCDGVDISPTMIGYAREFNQYGDRCTYTVNGEPNLAVFPGKSFDFIYSNIVLQHIEPDLSENYVREFVRILADGGIAMFQVPSAFVGMPPKARLPEGAHRASITLLDRLPRMVPGQRTSVRVRVRNDGQHSWSCGVNAEIPVVQVNLRLGNHWRSPDGQVLVAMDDGRTSLEQDLDPGESAILPLVIEAPGRPGRYVLEFDIVEEEVAWFGDLGSPTLRLPVRVSRPPSGLRKLLERTGRPADDDSFVTPRLFEMHGLHRDRVVQAVESAGGRILLIEDYNPAGEGWESYRYFVTSDPEP
jgi:SAM-dependent methyltransferase